MHSSETRKSMHRTGALALAAAGLAFAMLLPAGAHASVTTVVNADACHGLMPSDEANLSRYAGNLEAVEAATVVCPITKTTSGPGISNDKLVSVTVTGYSGWGDCTLTEYSTDISLLPTNVRGQSKAQFSGYYYTPVLYGSVSGYWGNSSNWTAAQLVCHLSGGVNLQHYSVVEAGTAQAGRRIGSSTFCKSLGAGSTVNFYEGLASDPSIIPNPAYRGGYFESVDSGFKMQCPTPAGTYVQIAFGPAFGGTHQIGCRNNSTTTFSYVPTSAVEWVSKTLVLSNSSPLTCQQKDNAADGDGKILAFRTGPTSTF
jgi:hypothetical protein